MLKKYEIKDKKLLETDVSVGFDEDGKMELLFQVSTQGNAATEGR